MDRFVERQNIKNCAKQLLTETNPTKREAPAKETDTYEAVTCVRRTKG